MYLTKLLSRLSLVAGVSVIIAPALAAHQSGPHASSAAPPYGYGMPKFGGYGYQRPAVPPYAYPRPAYRPPYPKPYGKPYGKMMRPAAPYGFGYPAAGSSPTPAAPATAAASETATAAAVHDEVADQASVSIRQMQFSPARVTVKKGATVSWTQQDSMPHDVTASDGSFKSETLRGGGTFARTFDEPGTYKFYCSLHPSMRGEIVVVD